MKGKIFILTWAILLAVSSLCFAAQVKPITVSATIETISGGLDVTVTKVRASDDYWDTATSSSSLPIAFGILTLDPVWKVFRATDYYAVDVGVNDNTGTAWTLTHTRTSIARDGTNRLDTNVNVSFMKQTSPTEATQLQKVSYANSNNVAYTKAQLAGGWLRIYYGIATGNTDPAAGPTDAPGVLPITLDKPAGAYSGSVTITLTP